MYLTSTPLPSGWWQLQDRCVDLNATYRDPDFSLFETHMQYMQYVSRVVARQVKEDHE